MADVKRYYSLDAEWSPFEALRAAATVATHIFETEGEGNPPPQRREGAKACGIKRPRPFKSKNPRVINNPPPPAVIRQPHPPLPETFQAAIMRVAGRMTAPAKLVIQKDLYSTDVNRDNNRFSIPLSQIVSTDFLTAEEKRHLDSYDKTGKNRETIEVRLLGPLPEMETVVKLARWNMTSSATYVINGAWRDVVANGGLKKKMKVQLWSFRVGRQLCFALVVLPGD